MKVTTVFVSVFVLVVVGVATVVSQNSMSDLESFLEVGTDLAYEKISNIKVVAAIHQENNLSNNRIQAMIPDGSRPLVSNVANVNESYFSGMYKNEYSTYTQHSRTENPEEYSRPDNMYSQSTGYLKLIADSVEYKRVNPLDNVTRLYPQWVIDDLPENTLKETLNGLEESALYWLILPFSEHSKYSIKKFLQSVPSEFLDINLNLVDEVVYLDVVFTYEGETPLLSASFDAQSPNKFYQIKYFSWQTGKLIRMIDPLYEDGQIKVIKCYNFIEGIDDERTSVMESESDFTYTVSFISIDVSPDNLETDFDYLNFIKPTDYVADNRLDLLYRADAIQNATPYADFDSFHDSLN